MNNSKCLLNNSKGIIETVSLKMKNFFTKVITNDTNLSKRKTNGRMAINQMIFLKILYFHHV